MFYLPKLKKISIYDYPLYTQPIIIDFSKKLNIVYGTNGTGKTTLLMIILFSIIGPYRGNVQTKTREGKRRDSRPIYQQEIFLSRVSLKDRMKTARVVSEFSVNKDQYVVEHSLEDCSLCSVIVNGVKLNGKIAQYKTFEMKYFSFNEEENLNDYLIQQYHERLKQSTQLPGNGIGTLISMLMDIMFFDERRKLSFWDSNLQELVIGKYIVEPEMYQEYSETKLQTKYLESMYKKASETLNYLRKFLKRESDELNGRSFNTKKCSNADFGVEVLEKKIQSLEKRIEQLRYDLNEKERQILNLYRKKEKIKEKVNGLEEEFYSNLFKSPYSDFQEKYSKVISNEICPACGQKHNFPIQSDVCVLCGEKLPLNKKINILEIDTERNTFHKELIQCEKNISYEKEIENKIRKELTDVSSELLILSQKKNTFNLKQQNDGIRLSEIDSIRISKMEGSIQEALKRYNDSKIKEIRMRNNIADNFSRNFLSFRECFNKYAGVFYGNGFMADIKMPLNLDETLDELNMTDKKYLIKFLLEDVERDSPYMLSESQRIFTDFAFRFTILTLFHTDAFFVCETPDSTLDSFHENQAVDVFKNFIANGNTLILSANYKKNDLIRNLYSQYKKQEVNVIDMSVFSSLSPGSKYSFLKYNGVNIYGD